MITILGGGAVGITLAIHLTNLERPVTLVRLRERGMKPERRILTLRHSDEVLRAEVVSVSLDEWRGEGDLLVITAKAFANRLLAEAIARCGVTAPICLLQNGIHVERPFLERGFPQVYRGVLYVTGESEGDDTSTLKSIQPSAVGTVRGDGLAACVAQLSTPGLPFVVTANIEQEVWKKGIINTVFNSICPLMEVDNGIFARSQQAYTLANQVVDECLHVAQQLGITLEKPAIMEAILRISQNSRHLISTLQDLRKGRPTEIEFFNFAIYDLAQQLTPPVSLQKTRLLGELVLLKSNAAQERSSYGEATAGQRAHALV